MSERIVPSTHEVFSVFEKQKIAVVLDDIKAISGKPGWYFVNGYVLHVSSASTLVFPYEVKPGDLLVGSPRWREEVARFIAYGYDQWCVKEKGAVPPPRRAG